MRFLLLLFFFSTGPDSCLWKFHPSLVTLGISCYICLSKFLIRKVCLSVVSCQTGHYQKSVEETLSGVILFAYPSCVPCPLGSFQPFEDQTGCTQCYPGSYQNKLGQNSCRPCPRGSYQPYRGESSCSLCPNGTTTDDIGSASVETCKPIESKLNHTFSICI